MCAIGRVIVAVGLSLGTAAALLAADESSPGLGQELFHRVWEPNDPRSHGGDGLGPLFNERSCVSCHFLGAPGGAGPFSKNVQVITAPVNPNSKSEQEQARKQLVDAHPDFGAAFSIVLHRQGTNRGYATWRDKHFPPLRVPESGSRLAKFALRRAPALSAVFSTDNKAAPILSDDDRTRLQFELRRSFGRNSAGLGGFGVILSERNTPPLFGLSLIDALPDSILEESAARKHSKFSEIKGRLSRLEDGRIGRFGWKGQKATLREFSLSAAAVEIGLHITGHDQGHSPVDAQWPPRGYDLVESECDALAGYVAFFAAPVRKLPDNSIDRQWVESGEKLFSEIGCAECHTPKLGDVAGIFSDMLLHDMGVEISESGGGNKYGSSPPAEKPPPNPEDVPAKKLLPATDREWRTPPLWGVGDSAPYLHDGRADTLDEAIRRHGGEGKKTAQRYAKLDELDRRHLVAFLESLRVK